MLKPYLREETAEGLLAAATHKSKSQIERLLAERFPRPDVLEWVTEAPESANARSAGPVAPGTVHDQVAPGRLAAAPPGHLQLASGRVIPLSAQSGELQCTLSRSGQDNLRYAQALLGHQVPSGSVGTVIELALKALVSTLERFGATARPRHGKRSSGTGRHIPVAVRRAVWERDQGQCTFVAESGRRCQARKPLEFDHITPVARGGEATVEGVRLRCRAPNQYEAERMFGAGFMQEKRDAARRASEARRTAAAKAQAARVEARARADAEARASAPSEETLDVIAGLRSLGFRADEARRAAARTDTLENATIEDRLRAALRSLGRRPVSVDSVQMSVAVPA